MPCSGVAEVPALMLGVFGAGRRWGLEGMAWKIMEKYVPNVPNIGK